jgi:hypothetical protein
MDVCQGCKQESIALLVTPGIVLAAPRRCMPGMGKGRAWQWQRPLAVAPRQQMQGRPLGCRCLCAPSAAAVPAWACLRHATRARWPRQGGHSSRRLQAAAPMARGTAPGAPTAPGRGRAAARLQSAPLAPAPGSLAAHCRGPRRPPPQGHPLPTQQSGARPGCCWAPPSLQCPAGAGLMPGEAPMRMDGRRRRLRQPHATGWAAAAAAPLQ